MNRRGAIPLLSCVVPFERMVAHDATIIVDSIDLLQ